MKPFLLIDVGNGRTKLALSTSETILDRRELATREVSAETLTLALADWEYGRVIACSVVPKTTAVLRDFFPADFT